MTIKLFKNSRRQKAPQFKPYVPQYKVLGVEPDVRPPMSYVAGQAPQLANPEPLPMTNPRAVRPMMRQQPYAETSVPSIGRGKGILPNVGNNMEHSWAGVDAELIDDLPANIDPSHPMIDNNIFVYPTDDPKNKEYMEVLENELLPETSSNDNLISAIEQLADDYYLLILHGQPICAGSQQEVQEQAKLMAFGDHADYDDPVSIEEIIIVKRAKVKIGLFLE